MTETTNTTAKEATAANKPAPFRNGQRVTVTVLSYRHNAVPPFSVANLQATVAVAPSPFPSLLTPIRTDEERWEALTGRKTVTTRMLDCTMRVSHHGLPAVDDGYVYMTVRPSPPTATEDIADADLAQTVITFSMQIDKLLTATIERYKSQRREAAATFAEWARENFPHHASLATDHSQPSDATKKS